MRFYFTGSIPKELTEKIKSLKGDYTVTFEKATGKRTTAQNAALHLWCKLQAEEFVEKGIDMREFFKEEFFLEWTPHTIKENIWKKLQKALFGTASTTKLKKSEQIDTIHRNIEKIITEKYKGNVETIRFPSEEELFIKYTNERNEKKGRRSTG